MITKFASVDDLLKELETTKFDVIGLHYNFIHSFHNIIKVSEEVPGHLLIKDKLFPIVKDDPECLAVFIRTESLK